MHIPNEDRIFLLRLLNCLLVSSIVLLRVRTRCRVMVPTFTLGALFLAVFEFSSEKRLMSTAHLQERSDIETTAYLYSPSSHTYATQVNGAPSSQNHYRFSQMEFFTGSE